MKSEESMAGVDSKQGGTCSELAGTHVTKFRSSKGPELEKLQNSVEFQADFPTKGSMA
jgi:hypothetical protein